MLAAAAARLETETRFVSVSYLGNGNAFRKRDPLPFRPSVGRRPGAFVVVVHPAVFPSPAAFEAILEASCFTTSFFLLSLYPFQIKSRVWKKRPLIIAITTETTITITTAINIVIKIYVQ